MSWTPEQKKKIAQPNTGRLPTTAELTAHTLIEIQEADIARDEEGRQRHDEIMHELAKVRLENAKSERRDAKHSRILIVIGIVAIAAAIVFGLLK